MTVCVCVCDDVSLHVCDDDVRLCVCVCLRPIVSAFVNLVVVYM